MLGFLRHHQPTEFKPIFKYMNMSKPSVVVGMSGGVDSSVTAWLLKQQGYEVIGLFMKNWEDDDEESDGTSEGYCSARQDWLDVVSVADKIGIDVEVVNFAQEYKERVFEEFLSEYSAGRTPNPDVLCNAEIKFKAFLEHALHLKDDSDDKNPLLTTTNTKIATGHYARLRETAEGKMELLKAQDASKDQSYFLHRLTQSQLQHTLFPLGELTKVQVREIATQIGLPNARKKDSTGICFIGERPFRAFLQRYLPTEPGPIKTLEGQILGEHIGLSFYTLGQRKGLGVGGQREPIGRGSGQEPSSHGQPWFVAAKDLAKNTLYVVQGHQHPALTSHRLTAQRANWIAGEPPKSVQLHAKTRYRQMDAPCMLSSIQSDLPTEQTISAQFALDFNTPQWAVTPGQSAVLYEGEVCLGGGIIHSTI